jgi:uroporphyrinogen decarboxylase
LNHEEPDRVPLDLGGLTTTIETDPYEELKAYLGIEGKTEAFVRDHVAPHPEVLDKFNIDTRYIRIKPPTSLYWDPVDHPLKAANIEDLKTYPWPDPDDPGRYEGLRKEAKRLKEETDFAVIADQPVLGLFESGPGRCKGNGHQTTEVRIWQSDYILGRYRYPVCSTLRHPG